MSALSTRLTGLDDFNRAFEMAERLVQYELKMKYLPDLMTSGAANDTMAAIMQAKALVLHILKSGYSLADMHRWVDMLVMADEEERAKLKAVSNLEFDKPFEARPVLTVKATVMSEEEKPW